MLTMAVGSALSLATPSVDDMPTRVAERLAAHNMSVSTLPVTGRVATALIATEDSRFYQHSGVDLVAMPRAAVELGRGNRDLGGATLDQQLVKMLYLPGRNDLAGKVEQAALAMKVNSTFGKPEILQAYLTAVYFGHGYYGLADAAQGYFGLAPDKLSWAQASLLAGLVQAPSAYDPLSQLPLAKQRQRHVLDRLVAAGALNAAEADAAFAEPLYLRPGTTPAAR